MGVQNFFSNFSQGNQMVLVLAILSGFVYLASKTIDKGGTVSLNLKDGFKCSVNETASA